MPKKKRARVASASEHIKQLTKHWDALAKLLDGATEKQLVRIDAMVIAWAAERGFTLTSEYQHLLHEYFSLRNTELEKMLAVPESPRGLRRRLLLEKTKKQGKRLKEAIKELRQSHPELMANVKKESTLRNDMSEPNPDESELTRQIRTAADQAEPEAELDVGKLVKEVWGDIPDSTGISP